MTIKEFTKALENGKVQIFRSGTGYSNEYKAKYNRYSIVANGKKLDHYNSDWIAKLPYYSKRSESLAMTTWGQSQEFEAKNVLTTAVMFDKLGKYSHDYFSKWVETIQAIY